MNSNFEIIELPKENWKGVSIPLVTRSDSFYDLIMDPLDSSGCKISLIRKKAEKEIVHTPEEYDSLIPCIRSIMRKRKPMVWSVMTGICWLA